MIGTFIVRSGLLTSVHAFATDPERGLFILLLLVHCDRRLAVLFALRAPALKAGGLFAPISREGGLVLNNLLLGVSTGTVFLGTLAPLFAEAFDYKLSVGAPYFNLFAAIFGLPLMAAMGIGPLLPWKRADLAGALGRLKVAAGLTFIAGLATWYLQQGGPVLAIVGMVLAAWLFFATLAEWAERVQLFRVSPAASLSRALRLPRAAYGMTFAHIGMAVAVAGMTASSAWKAEEVRVMRPGETVEVAGYSYRFEDVREQRGPNYFSEIGRFTVTRQDQPVAELTPEKRFYPVQQMPTTEAAIHTTGVSDLYAVIGDSDGQGGWTVRIYHEPLVPWLWAGALLMVLGGCVSLSDRRLRVGAPRRRTAPAPAAATAS